MNLRLPGVPGALLSTTIVAATPSVAASDTQSPTGTAAAAATAAPPTAKAASALSVRHVRRDVLAGRSVVVSGTLQPAAAGRAVSLQVSRGGHGWTTVDHDRTDSTGRYRLVWHAARTGTRRVRVHFGGTRELSSTHLAAGTARVYRRAVASWYGPGFYGRRLACGGRLKVGMLGVANKTLPCGAKVTLYYRGRTVRVPVIDRGPYVGGREFDLTAATRARLRFGSTGVVMSTR
jgi:rare lipoprotein A (peptidoglycan hydrolase)